jgi:hypothetical protein
MTAKEKKNILFFHPDLGIGGAERLIIDAAVGLQNRGHKVVIFTSHCDPKHCFDEARDGMPLKSVASHPTDISFRYPRCASSWRLGSPTLHPFQILYHLRHPTPASSHPMDILLLRAQATEPRCFCCRSAKRRFALAGIPIS